MSTIYRVRLVSLLCFGLLSSTAWSQDSAGQQILRTWDEVRRHNTVLTSEADGLIVKYRDSAAMLAGMSTTERNRLGGREVSEETRDLRVKQGVQERVHSRGHAFKSMESLSAMHRLVKLDRPVSLEQARGLADDIARLPDIEHVHVDHRMVLASASTDRHYPLQWYLWDSVGGIRADKAWDTKNTIATALIAVLDSGELSTVVPGGKMPPTYTGYDFYANRIGSLDPGDSSLRGECYAGSPDIPNSWHGTGVASIINTMTNDGSPFYYGGSGMANERAGMLHWPTGLQPTWVAVRVTGSCGGSESKLINGIRWASGQSVSGVPSPGWRARVISIQSESWVPTACSPALQAAIDGARANGAIVVVAAGNGLLPASAVSPANCANTVVVAATTRNGNLAYYSNYGSKVTIAAPGGDISSSSAEGILVERNLTFYGAARPYNQNDGYVQGTSYAAPMVAGVIGRMLAVKPSLTEAAVIDILMSTAHPGAATCTGNCGAGILDAYAAINKAATSTVKVNPPNCSSDPRLCQ